MKLCAVCCQELPQSSFSKKQRQSKQYHQRCTTCIDDDRVMHLKAPPKKEFAEVQYPSLPLDAKNECASCWICLDEGPDEDGQPLRRDCSCRGESAGFAHLSCTIKYAEQKSLRFYGRDVNKFGDPWQICPNCKQLYQCELALDLATTFLTFVERHYPCDKVALLEALSRKRGALAEAGSTEGKLIACKIISMIRKMRAKSSSLPKRIIQMEVMAYSGLGHMACVEGTEKNVKLAVRYFEKARDLSKAMGCDSGVVASENNMAIAKSKCEGANSVNDERLPKSQALYKECTEQSGQMASSTIRAGMNLAVWFDKVNRAIEAERLLTKIASTSRQVHGPDHCITQSAESKLQCCKVRIVVIKTDDGGNYFQALRYEEEETCVIQGPITNPRNIKDEKTFTVPSDRMAFTFGTPVVCHGFDTSPHLDGKVGDLRSWEKESKCFLVHFEDKDLEPHLVKQDNIRILFEFPDA